MFIKKSAILFILLFVMSLPVWANETTGNINLIFGKKLLNNDFDPISKHDELGVSFDIKNKNWPVSIAIEAFGSSGEKTVDEYIQDEYLQFYTITIKTGELCLGLKKIFDIRDFPLKPFLGAGLAYIYAEYEIDPNPDYISPQSYDDAALGYWLSAGIFVKLSDHINTGVIAHLSRAKVKLFNDHEDEVGGEHYGIFIGYHW